MRRHRSASRHGTLVRAPGDQDSMEKYWIGLLCRVNSRGMHRGDAEPLVRARIRLGHLRTPRLFVTLYNCVNDFVYVLYVEYMLHN